MSKSDKPSLRIDWFDGTVIEEPRVASSVTNYGDESTSEPTPQPHNTERKLMGFKRLLDLSQQDATSLTLQLSGRSSFWDLLQTDLKNDYIVLVVEIIAKLYFYLQSGQKSPMLRKLIQTKFIPSNFMGTLYNYILNLPSTRIVEKRMNLSFWEDPESFFQNLLIICEGIVANTPEESIKTTAILEILEASVKGVMTEHMETFSDELFHRIYNLNDKIQGIFKKSVENTPSKGSKDSFSNMNIFPTREDIFGKTICNLKPNIVNGAYTSVEHYLDVQFKLLREDYFGPLREGISKYMEDPTKSRHENIRVHPKVRVIKSYVSNNNVGHLVDIAWRKRSSNIPLDERRIYSKQLMFGSLLLFTSDNFETLLCATVWDSNQHFLKEGYIVVLFHTPISSSIFSESYVMVESEVFFEPYHRVLKVLQQFSGKDIPMSRYIVYVQPETNPPGYISKDTVYSTIAPDKTEVSFHVLDINNWPTSDVFGLDHSQMEAYKLALTREFAVIQGPPGTGKTFIGIKVASTLLRNLSLEGTPMLVICYTNHGLDQFLEGILTVTKNVIRLGSQSKSAAVEPYTLSNLRAKSKTKFSYLYMNKRREQEKLFQQMMAMQGDIEKSDNEILDYKTIKNYFKIGSKKYELNNSQDEDPVIEWLFNEEMVKRSTEEVINDWEQEFDDKTTLNEDNSGIDSCFSEQLVQKEIDSMKNSIKYVRDVTEDPAEIESMTDRFKSQINKLRDRLRIFKENMKSLRNDTDIKDPIRDVDDIYMLPLKDRWLLYFKTVEAVKESLLDKMDTLKEQHKTCTEELEEVTTLVDSEMVRTARVVGVTTSAAARRNHLLQTLDSSIVIIEEAAEVLESHIVASLTHQCKHVILIGDHKQLRPTTSHFKLAKNFNMDVSLFERMIRNGVHARTLTTQHRMRPVFVDLIVPVIYERLDCHPDVVGYPSVRGVGRDLFFLTHTRWEDEESDDSWSYKNAHEARWCVGLANYLRLKLYETQDVTILTTYTGQASLIKTMSKKFPLVKDCRITVVDNYQGEESRIVILSLVRSNREGKIGFLAAQNRICVALSRAREGFFIFGNMNVLCNASPVWRKINERLISRNVIGDSMMLRCSVHPENTMSVNVVEDFENCLNGQCLSVCGQK